MTKSEFLHAIAKQCNYSNALIVEAHKSRDLVQKVKLYSMARTENNNMIKSLNEFLSKVRPHKKLKAA